MLIRACRWATPLYGRKMSQPGRLPITSSLRAIGKRRTPSGA
jgi:hypothetical protein